MTQNNMKVWLVVKSSYGHQGCDEDDEGNPSYYMSWESIIRKIPVDALDLKSEIGKYQDADYDYSSEVLYVVGDHDKILVDFTAPRHYLDYFSLLKRMGIELNDEQKNMLFNAQMGINTDWDRKRNSEIETVMAEAKYGHTNENFGRD